ncbi:hypothetical protein U1Q18_035523 [Sarracenia purpurea var. burkii]
MNALCEEGNIFGMFEVLCKMEERAVEPTNVTYTNQNVGLTKVAYTTLIKAHCAKGDVHKVDMLFHQMVQKGFEISVRDYCAVINRLCKKNLTTKVKVFLRMMLSDGISLDQEISSVLLNAFHQVGDLNSKFELLA